MMKLRQFITGEDNLDPWIASKLAVMDHSADAIYDYMAYGDEGDEEEGEEEEDDMEEEEEAPMTENELEEMKNGGIPERYRKRGFTKVGVKRKSTRPGMYIGTTDSRGLMHCLWEIIDNAVVSWCVYVRVGEKVRDGESVCVCVCLCVWVS